VTGASPSRRPATEAEHLHTHDGTEVVVAPLVTGADEDELFEAFRAGVAAGEGYPQDPARPLDDAEIRE
jgi:hypothetical protein